MPVIRIRARVTGLVQGVFYRASTEREARRLGLAGWVRNCDDGAVELEAEGPAERVDALVAWCRRGPPAARVQAIDVESIATVGGGGFHVRG
jgi:acylphosphatase